MPNSLGLGPHLDHRAGAGAEVLRAPSSTSRFRPEALTLELVGARWRHLAAMWCAKETTQT